MSQYCTVNAFTVIMHAVKINHTSLATERTMQNMLSVAYSCNFIFLSPFKYFLWGAHITAKPCWLWWIRKVAMIHFSY